MWREDAGDWMGHSERGRRCLQTSGQRKHVARQDEASRIGQDGRARLGMLAFCMLLRELIMKLSIALAGHVFWETLPAEPSTR